MPKKSNAIKNQKWTRELELQEDDWNWDKLAKRLDPNNEDHATYLIPAYNVRKYFGMWDWCDPVAVAIVNLAGAQNEISLETCMEQYADPDEEADIEAAKMKRSWAIMDLVRAWLLEDDNRERIGELFAPVSRAIVEQEGSRGLNRIIDDLLKQKPQQ